MKKLSSILLSVVLVLAMLMTLTGCGATDQEKILGTWRTTIDIADVMEKELEDSGMEMEIEELELVLEATFKEDGTYEMEVPAESVENLIEDMKKVLRPYLEELYTEMAEAYGMTMEELLEAGGSTLDELIDEAFDESAGEEMAEGFQGEGQYKIEDGKLYTSDDEDDEPDADMYEVYKFEGDKMIWTENVGDDDAKDMPYPITFEKVK